MADFTIIENNLVSLNSIESSINAAMHELIDSTYEKVQLVPEGAAGNFSSCKQYMTAYIEALEKIKKCKQAFTEVRDNREQFDEKFKEDFLHLYESKISQSENPELHPNFKMMMDAIVNISTDENSTEQATVDETDDLVLMQTKTIPLDPISRKEVLDPVRHKVCHHIYDRNSITDYILQNRRARCPMAGCNSKLAEDMLEVDEGTLLLISRKRRELNKLS